MKNNLKKMFRNSLIYSICFIILGLFLLIKPSATISLISYIIGGIIIIAGILTFTKSINNNFKSITFSFDLIYSILSVISGIIIYFKSKRFSVNYSYCFRNLDDYKWFI